MKSIALKSLVILAGAISAASALAQDNMVTANVPFAFNVQNTVLPAGRYQIEQTIDRQVLDGVIIRNIDNPKYAVLALVPEGPQAPSQEITNARLVFDKSSGQYFLREVRGPVNGVNAKFLVTKTENSAKP
ncbi:MAG: hypothetical protein JO300_04500 [Silvibacterium sp.]|nr:hypothetical protein [Silvibacterium sp.]MBV8437497.1 hypothetical protein [Silvibacterium sp.]